MAGSTQSVRISAPSQFTRPLVALGWVKTLLTTIISLYCRPCTAAASHRSHKLYAVFSTPDCGHKLNPCKTRIRVLDLVVKFRPLSPYGSKLFQQFNIIYFIQLRHISIYFLYFVLQLVTLCWSFWPQFSLFKL